MRIVAAIILVLALSATVFAKSATYRGCTSDKKIVALSLTLDDKALADHPGISISIGKAFSSAAKIMTADDLQGPVGFQAFVSGLTENDKAAIQSFSGAPSVLPGSCTP